MQEVTKSGIYDAIGNKIAKGQLVRLRLDEPCFFGRIVECNVANIVDPYSNTAKVVIVGDFTVLTHIGATLSDIVVLKEPGASTVGATKEADSS